MPFGEAAARLIGHQRTMVVSRSGPTERPEKQQLSSSREEQVRPADDFSNSHGGIIRGDRKLITWDPFLTPHHKVTEVTSGDKLLRALTPIVETDNFTFRNTEAPINFSVVDEV